MTSLPSRRANACPPVRVLALLVAAIALAPAVAAADPARPEPPKMAQPEVIPAAVIEIQTVLVQDKTTRPLGSDRATLGVGKRGAVKKSVTVSGGPKSKAAPQDVEIAVLVTPTSSAPSSVELVIETLALPKGTKEPIRSRARALLEPGGVKFMNVYSNEALGASINAFVRADWTEPIVKLPQVKTPTQSAATLGQPIQFVMTFRRLESGEEVYRESVTLNTYMGRVAAYEMGVDVPREVVADDKGRGTIEYAAEKAQISLTPLRFAGSELDVEVRVQGDIFTGTDLVNAHHVDRTVTARAAMGSSFSVYALYGRDELTAPPPAELAKASGYIVEVVPR